MSPTNPLSVLKLDTLPSQRITFEGELCEDLQRIDQVFTERVSQYIQALQIANARDEEHVNQIKKPYEKQGAMIGAEIFFVIGGAVCYFVPQLKILRLSTLGTKILTLTLFTGTGGVLGAKAGLAIAQQQRPNTQRIVSMIINQECASVAFELANLSQTVIPQVTRMINRLEERNPNDPELINLRSRFKQLQKIVYEFTQMLSVANQIGLNAIAMMQ